MAAYQVIDFNDVHVANARRSRITTSRPMAKAIARRRVRSEGFVRAMVIEIVDGVNRVVYDVVDHGSFAIPADRSGWLADTRR